MTRSAVIAKNRTNALKSTGPKTPSGKLVVSGNALQHGATARPKAEKVATWLRVILDQPSFGLEEVLSGGGHVGGALALAEAEASLSACEEALTTFERKAHKPADILPDLLAAARTVIIGLNLSLPTGFKLTYGRKILSNMILGDTDKVLLGGTRHRLLVRYRDEAQSRRWRAFNNWVAFLQRAAENSTVSRNKAKNTA